MSEKNAVLSQHEVKMYQAGGVDPLILNLGNIGMWVTRLTLCPPSLKETLPFPSRIEIYVCSRTGVGYLKKR